MRREEWSRITASPTGKIPYYMMYEMYFDNLETYHAAMKSEENRAAGKDLLSFAGDIVTLMIADAYEDEIRRPVGA